MLKFLNLIFILILTGCMSPSPQPDCNYIKNVFNERVSWKNKIPVVFYIDDSVPLDFRDSIIHASNVWNKAAGKSLFKVEFPINGNLSRYDSKNIIYYYSEFWPDTKRTQAKTLAYWVGDIMKDTDIIINGENFNYYTLNDLDSLNKVNLETLMIHEFGHTLGILHMDERNNVMYPSLALEEEKIYIDDDALKALKCEY